MVISIASILKQKFKGDGNTYSILLNVPDRVQPPIDLNVCNEARSTSGDDKPSLQASNLFFQRIDHHGAQVSQTLVINSKKMAGLMHLHLVRISIKSTRFLVQMNIQTRFNMDKKCLHPQLEQQRLSGEKPIEPDNLKAKLEQAKIPANCLFLNSKRVNRSVWTDTPVAQRADDIALQVIQKTHTASVSLILKAESEITNLLSKCISVKMI